MTESADRMGRSTSSGSALAALTNPASYRPPHALDELLRSIRLSGAFPAYTYLTAPFGVDVAYEADTLVFYEATAGSCLVRLQGVAEPVLFETGDAFIIPRHIRHTLVNVLDAEVIDLRELLSAQIEPYFLDEHGVPSLSEFLSHQVWHGGGGELFALRMLLMFVDRNVPSSMLCSLPSPILLKGFGTRRKALLESMFGECESQRESGFLAQPIYIRLAEALLAVALKDAATLHPGDPVYKGLADPVVSHIMSLIMHDPGRHWDLPSLAKEACLSGSALNTRFHASTGMAPGHFVIHARMLQASDMLANTSFSLAQIAEKAGYSSEAAFNRSYHRWSGVTPGKARTLRRRGG
ncbi:AraC family transcriptional regulator [Xanthomonas campestris pv. phormiicola]|nr:AraC family transcriptional regulator [Xanthomonas campestris pv. phormiicola]